MEADKLYNIVFNIFVGYVLSIFIYYMFKKTAIFYEFILLSITYFILIGISYILKSKFNFDYVFSGFFDSLGFFIIIAMITNIMDYKILDTKVKRWYLYFVLQIVFLHFMPAVLSKIRMVGLILIYQLLSV